MTNKEAVEIIKECKEKGFKHTFYTLNEYHTALDMAIQALEQEPCEDAISRQAVKEQMIKYGFHAPDMTVTEFVEDLPPVPCEDIISRQAEIGTVDEVVDESVDECHFLCQWNSGSRCTKNPNERNCHKRVSGEVGKGESNVLEQTCHTCKHYFHGKYDGSCYICNRYSNWKSEAEQ